MPGASLGTAVAPLLAFGPSFNRSTPSYRSYSRLVGLGFYSLIFEAKTGLKPAKYK